MESAAQVAQVLCSSIGRGIFLSWECLGDVVGSGRCNASSCGCVTFGCVPFLCSVGIYGKHCCVGFWKLEEIFMGFSDELFHRSLVVLRETWS